MRYLRPGLLLVTCVAVWTGIACHKPARSVASPVEFKNGLISVRADSPFLSLVTTAEVKHVAGRSRALQAIGQIVLLVIPSGSLTGRSVSAVHLDPALSASLGINHYALPPDTAVGIVELPVSEGSQIRVGGAIRVAMYGLRKAEAPARIRVIRASPDKESVTVVFVIPAAPEWYPGVSCRVTFPGIQSEPVVIPSRSLVHAGRQDFVFVEENSHAYRPHPVVVLEEKKTEMQVIGIRPDAIVMVRGAILLKPYLDELEGQK